ncbi:ABC transporter substrate-binding protein [Streptomyces sp. BI20]|uniref:ABC transporter substrate-binding protein n=1 Tax=Streptomyces sp. BI20 TaxID=3403460 RepID=UPI003C784AB0
MPRRPALPGLLSVVIALSLAGCAGAPGGPAEPRAATATAAGFPYTVDNCGVRTTFTAPPRRAVTMNQHATEILLALGLKDRLVGTAYLDDAIGPKYRADYEKIPVLAPEYPDKETLLAAEPDFVYGGYGSAFDKAAGRSRADLSAAHVNTRLNTEYCGKGPVGVPQLRTEITEVARTFGVPERGERLIAEETRRIDAAVARVAGSPRPTVFAFDSGEGSAFTSGGKGIGNEVITLAGGTNVFADLDDTFGDVSWEQVIDRAPQVILIYDYGKTDVEAKKKRLLEDPALASVPAVRDKRFVVLPLSSVVLGVRVADAVESLAGQLHP